MRDQFVRDFSDFVKYSLLRHLTSDDALTTKALSLGVVWYFVKDVPNFHGRHEEYLKDPKKWRHLDQSCFDVMGHIDKKVSEVERSGVLETGGGTVFWSDSIEDANRAQWAEGAIARVEQSDIVFLDPDNGIETRNIRGALHARMDEIKKFWAGGKRSLVIFQHSRRQDVRGMIDEHRVALRAELKLDERTPIYAIDVQPWHRRVFYLIPAPHHKKLLAARIVTFKERGWQKHIVEKD